MTIVIAVDGTAASGKGTLAKKLAAHFGFAHLDSGSLYRLVALGVLEAFGDPANEADALKAARAIDPKRGGDPAIRTAEIGNVASIVSAFPPVRDTLLRIPARFCQNAAGRSAWRGDRRARYRHRHLPGRHRQIVRRCPARNPRPSPLAGTAKPAHRPRAEAAILAEIMARDAARPRPRPSAPLEARRRRALARHL